eukprot:m.142543 g.142543  ORF g.142543 m.142543 type:complete len:175 (-) comp15996_c1_seq6:36-560(-)
MITTGTTKTLDRFIEHLIAPAQEQRMWPINHHTSHYNTRSTAVQHSISTTTAKTETTRQREEDRGRDGMPSTVSPVLGEDRSSSSHPPPCSVLCVLTCGRRATPSRSARPIMTAALRWTIGRSTISDGEGNEEIEDERAAESPGRSPSPRTAETVEDGEVIAVESEEERRKKKG